MKEALKSYSLWNEKQVLWLVNLGFEIDRAREDRAKNSPGFGSLIEYSCIKLEHPKSTASPQYKCKLEESRRRQQESPPQHFFRVEEGKNSLPCEVIIKELSSWSVFWKNLPVQFKQTLTKSTFESGLYLWCPQVPNTANTNLLYRNSSSIHLDMVQKKKKKSKMKNQKTYFHSQKNTYLGDIFTIKSRYVEKWGGGMKELQIQKVTTDELQRLGVKGTSILWKSSNFLITGDKTELSLGRYFTHSKWNSNHKPIQNFVPLVTEPS